MNIDDALLIKLINKDMEEKTPAKYHLEDEVLVKPKYIKLATNQVVYVTYFLMRQSNRFKVHVVSGTSVAAYTHENMMVLSSPNNIPGTRGQNYGSPVISAHWTDMKLFGQFIDTQDYLIRLTRLTFFPLKPCDEKS